MNDTKQNRNDEKSADPLRPDVAAGDKEAGSRNLGLNLPTGQSGQEGVEESDDREKIEDSDDVQKAMSTAGTGHYVSREAAEPTLQSTIEESENFAARRMGRDERSKVGSEQGR